MYLISLYFDDITNNKMQLLINQVAKVTGNTFMLDNKIPPHITLLAFETMDEQNAIDIFEENIRVFSEGKAFFASVGAFKKQVIYVEPVLNEYLHNMSSETYKIFDTISDIKFSPYYKPFGWIPHLSIGKHLASTQLSAAFEILVKQFVPFEGRITKIGIAKTNPHRDLKVIEMGKKY